MTDLFYQFFAAKAEEETVYPSVKELLSEEILDMMPANLAREIESRYRELGPKYLTNNLHTDGRQINGMMYTNRVQNCLEEIIDAAFCICGWLFKYEIDDSQDSIPQDAYIILVGLCNLYTLLRSNLDDEVA